MYAIIEAGGKQYRVSENDIIEVNRMDLAADATIEMEKVLLIGGTESVQIGQPYLTSAKVQAKVLAHTRGEKKIVYKFRRRKDMDKKTGHRQDLTRLMITAISA